YTSTLAVGGNDFTRAIAAELKLDFDEAEKLKKKNLKLNLQKGATESEFVLFSLVTGLIKRMLNDIITVMENFKIKYKIVSSIPVIFSGGTSIIKNFDKYVENELRVRCLKFKMPVSKVDDVNKELALELGPSLMVAFSLSMNKIIRSGDQQELSDEKPQEKKSLWDILTSRLF
ncbi:MAG: cell division protein FtsA, partial [Candidatus Eremiobacterota bacterium]